MSPGGVVLLLWWLSDRGAAVWRYSTNSPNLRIFGVRSTIHLEYEGTSFSEWSVPKLCSVKEKRWTKTDVRCPSPGFHEIKPIVTGPVKEESRFLSVDNSRFCFSWYYRVTSFLQNLTQVVSIWVYDPENADPEELTWKAEEPSLNSKLLTRQLATLGQKPTIITVLKRRHFFSKRLSSNGVWKLSVPMTKSDILKNIMGNKVALQDCFVADLLFLMTFPLKIAPEIPGSLPLTVPRGKQLIVDGEACIPSSLVVVAEMETFQTNDSFITWTKIRVPPGILNDDERHKVTDMCLSRGKIYFVINGVLYLKDFHKFVRLGRNENLPDNGIIGTASRRWCWVSYLMKSQGQRSNVAVWTENEAYLDVWYQPNNIRQQGLHNSLKFSKIVTTTELKNILHLSPAATLTIHNIEYTAHPLELALLLSYCVFCTSSTKIYLVIYNEDTKEFVHKDFAVDVPMGSSLALRFLYSAVPEVLLWDKHRIYYSNYNFKESGILKTPTENGNLSKLSQDSSIQDVLLDYFGNIIVKMENNVMFYSKINVKDVIKLHLWTNATVKTFFSMDVTGLFYAVYISGKGDLQRQHYPLELEAQSAIFQNNEECPYFAFHTSLRHIFYFLDKREALSFWVQMTYQENTGLYIISESYGPKIIKEKRKLTFEIILGRCTKTMVVIFSQDVNYEAADNYFQLQRKTVCKCVLMLFMCLSLESPVLKRLTSLAAQQKFGGLIPPTGGSKERPGDLFLKDQLLKTPWDTRGLAASQS